MSLPTTILVLGGAGAQTSFVVRELAKSEAWKVRLLTRNPQAEEAASLATLPRVQIIEGDCYDENTLFSAFRGIDACFVNTNGFAIGEKSEIFWGIRMYEIAHWAALCHLYRKKGNFDPKYRVPFVDGKAKVVEFLRAQTTDQMIWSVLESGPYAEHFLLNQFVPKEDSAGEFVFRIPIGPSGSMPLVSLSDLAWFARYMFENPSEFKAELLSVGIEHATGQRIAGAFSAVTGKKARYEPLPVEELKSQLSQTTKIGLAGSPGYDDPTLKTVQEMFLPWWGIWTESHGNIGLWTRDYGRLDRIKPGRLRTVEQWMSSVGYHENMEPQNVLKSGSRTSSRFEE
ncbi:hypothetical protein N7448_010719 [Penicillium atrosanguineum]|nr:hypothetical protein N7448_010719 [Penicillium atrosanguineum]